MRRRLIMQSGSDITIIKKPAPIDNGTLCFEALSDNSSVTLYTNNASFYSNPQISYDDVNWIDWAFNKVVKLNKGEKVYWRSNNIFLSVNERVYSRFTMSGTISASGNVGSMVMGTRNRRGSELYNLFAYCTSLVKVPYLPSPEGMGTSCLRGVFRGCTSLTEVPENLIPWTDISSNADTYESLFEGCTRLVKPPILYPNTINIWDYNRIFYGCTSLSEIKILAKHYVGSGSFLAAFNDWTTGVNSAGELYVDEEMYDFWLNNKSYIPTNFVLKKCRLES